MQQCRACGRSRGTPHGSELHEAAWQVGSQTHARNVFVERDEDACRRASAACRAKKSETSSSLKITASPSITPSGREGGRAPRRWRASSRCSPGRAAGEDAGSAVLDDRDGAISVVLDLVQPLAAAGSFGDQRGQGGRDEGIADLPSDQEIFILAKARGDRDVRGEAIG
jgi:hypothetical protein